MTSIMWTITPLSRTVLDEEVIWNEFKAHLTLENPELSHRSIVQEACLQPPTTKHDDREGRASSRYRGSSYFIWR